jgi:lipopolysaccharide transport system ATP-binding protein
MEDMVATVDAVGKKFCRRLKRSLWYGLRDLGSELTGRSSAGRALRKDEFWAVKDASLQVRRGETLGLIGHNGAGKTTLLRMLAGLIKPDAGRIEIRGRVQALIALGAGFNPLLTGRENIYVNASILGVSKQEIDRFFEAIVSFAGIEESIDMPVQSYSSGMTVRLGFSIAAHLDPDILLVDEVLSVGDLAFRAKCQVRIQELKQRGVAIVLVSHNLHTISHVCTRAITFDRGHVIFDGDTEAAIDAYRGSLIRKNVEIEHSVRAGTGEIRAVRVGVLNARGQDQVQFEVGESVTLRTHFVARARVQAPVFNVMLHVLHGEAVTGIRTDVDGVTVTSLEGEGYVDLRIPNLNLLPNVYTVDVAIFHRDGYTFYDKLNNVASIKIGGGRLVNGTTFLPHSWHVVGSRQAMVLGHAERRDENSVSPVRLEPDSG